jgi:hypothetical protein
MKRLLTVLFFLGLLLVMFLLIRSPFNFYDEGFAVTGASRVLRGEAPYKDFWAIYPPGQFYAIAASFKLFGENLAASRTYDTLGRFLTVVAVFLIARRVTHSWLAYVAAGVTAVFLAAATFYSYAVFPALCLGYWAIFAWLAGAGAGSTSRRWLAGSGVLLGLAALVRWDIGAYAAVAIGVGRLIQFSLQGRFPRSLLEALKKLLWIAVPALIVAGLGYTAVILRSGLGVVFDQVFSFPALRLHDLRWVSYPPLSGPDFRGRDEWLRFYLPILTFAVGGLLFLWRGVTSAQARQSAAKDGAAPAALALVIFGALCFNQALSRYDLIHVTPASIAALLVAFAVAGQAKGFFQARWVLIVGAALSIVLTWLYFFPSAKTLREYTANWEPWRCHSEIAKAACVALDPNQAQAVEYIQANTRPGTPLYAGNTVHDKIFANDAGFYFLADRPPATRYHELHPGVVTSQPVQAEMTASLEHNQPPYIVEYAMWESDEPNASAKSFGVHVLDEYIAAHYTLVNQYGPYVILKKK